MIAKFSPIKGARPIVQLAASLLVFFLIAALLPAQIAAAAEDELCFLGINDNQLDNSARSWSETMPGNIYADAVRECAQTDFAVVPAGVFAEKRIEHGKITMSDITDSLAQDDLLAVAEVTAAELKAILENGVSAIVLDPETEGIIKEQSASDDFLQVSGFSVVCDVSAPVGDRIMYIRDAEGDELDFSDTERTYTVSSCAGLLSRFVPCETLEQSLSQAVAEYLPGIEGLTEYDMGRISIVGTTDDKLINRIPVWTVAFAAVFFGFAGLLVLRAKEQS